MGKKERKKRPTGSYIQKGKERLPQATITLTQEHIEFLEMKANENLTNKSHYVRMLLDREMKNNA